MPKRLQKQRLSKTELELLMDLGPEFSKYLEDSRLKGQRKQKARFKVGEQVNVRGHGFGLIVLGPYNNAFGEPTYEIELESGELITQVDDGEALCKYIPEVERVETDDF